MKNATSFISRSILVMATLLNLTATSVVAATICESSDSNKIEISESVSVGDERNATKISLPDGRTFRKADREMNRNMANHIRELKNLRLDPFTSIDADETITNEFYENFKLVNFYSTSAELDDHITSIFIAENLNIYFSKYSLLSDNELNNQFNSELR